MKKISYLRLSAYFIVLVSSIIMAACGGGGGSSDVVQDEGWVSQFGSTMWDLPTVIAVHGEYVYIAGLTEGDLDGYINQGYEDVFLCKYDVLGNLLWTVTLGSSDSDNVTAMAVDSSGNIYLAGGTSGFLPYVQLGSDYGNSDIFLIKYDSNGNFIWGWQTGTTSNDEASHIALDGSGGVYIAGMTEGSMDTNINQGVTDIFIMKFDTDGNLHWTRSWGSLGYDEVNGLLCNGGYVYIIGRCGLNDDYYFTRFDGAGTASWLPTPYSTWDGPSVDYIKGIAADGNGNIYLAGNTNGGWGDGYLNAGGFDMFVVKYGGGDINNWLWTRLWGSTGDESVVSLVVTIDGDIYIAGATTGVLDGNANQGSNDVFLVKYNTSGDRLWTRTLGSSNDDLANALALDESGNVYIAGRTYGTLEGVTNQGFWDVFGGRYSSSGERLWLDVLGSSGREEIMGIAVDGNNLYAVGYTDGELDGTNAGDYDIFLTTYAP